MTVRAIVLGCILATAKARLGGGAVPINASTPAAENTSSFKAFEAEVNVSDRTPRVGELPTASNASLDSMLRHDDFADAGNGTASLGTSRLRITNGCNREPIWIAHCCGFNYRQNVKIRPGGFHDFPVYAGLRGARFWPKMRCDRNGNGCLVGQSGGLGQPCGSGGDWRCMPHIDTKFEVTFGHRHDYWDLSAVDGYTLPAKVELSGSNCRVPGSGNVLDCSRLTMSACPTSEYLSGRRSDLRLFWANKVAGCFSPCTKAQDLRHHPASHFARPYCCPNPPVSRQQCLAGHMPRTQFVRNVRSRCERIYTHSYDDDFGNLNCPRGTRYDVTFFCLA